MLQTSLYSDLVRAHTYMYIVCARDVFRVMSISGVLLMANVLSLSASSTQRFHFRCGKNIKLSDNNTVAERSGDCNNGIVFTEQPVALGTVFQVKILEYDDSQYVGSIVSV